MEADQRHSPPGTGAPQVDLMNGGMILGHDDGVDLQVFRFPELASAVQASRTGMKNELILLAWALTLARIRESTTFSINWACSPPISGSQRIGEENLHEIAVHDVIQNLIDTVEDASTRLSPLLTAAEAGMEVDQPGLLSLYLTSGDALRLSNKTLEKVTPLHKCRKLS